MYTHGWARTLSTGLRAAEQGRPAEFSNPLVIHEQKQRRADAQCTRAQIYMHVSIVQFSPVRLHVVVKELISQRVAPFIPFSYGQWQVRVQHCGSSTRWAHKCCDFRALHHPVTGTAPPCQRQAALKNVFAAQALLLSLAAEHSISRLEMCPLAECTRTGRQRVNKRHAQDGCIEHPWRHVQDGAHEQPASRAPLNGKSLWACEVLLWLPHTCNVAEGRDQVRCWRAQQYATWPCSLPLDVALRAYAMCRTKRHKTRQSAQRTLMRWCAQSIKSVNVLRFFKNLPPSYQS
jgi:hypothetical protein